MNKIFLENLPVYDTGANKGRFDWAKSVGFDVVAVFNEKEYIIKIVGYEKDKSSLMVECEDRIANIKLESFKKCNIKKLVEPAMSFKDKCILYKRFDLLERWDYDLNGCSPKDVPSCSGGKWWFKCNNHIGEHKSVMRGINGIVGGKYNSTLDCPECNSIGKYICDKYGDEKINSIWSDKNSKSPFCIMKASHEKYWFICQRCGAEKLVACSMYSRNGLACNFCNDGFSYPNKFIANFLAQLNINYKTEKTFKWAKDKKYDHYIESISMIIENHGRQHYEEVAFSYKGVRTLKEEQKNDELKEGMARANGIKNYIVLDCRYSELEWIKNSIMNSGLPRLLNFKEEDVDWRECEERACSTTLIEICNMWDSGDFLTVTELASHLGRDRSSIRKQLKQGSGCGLCKYDPKDEQLKNSKRKGLAKIKPMQILKDGVVVGEYNGAVELSEVSQEVYGVKMLANAIRAVCSGNQKTYKGFTFRYV